MTQVTKKPEAYVAPPLLIDSSADVPDKVDDKRVYEDETESPNPFKLTKSLSWHHIKMIEFGGDYKVINLRKN